MLIHSAIKNNLILLSKDSCFTNYEKLDKFECGEFSGIILDESSILKSFTGKVRNQIIEYFSLSRLIIIIMKGMYLILIIN